MIIAEMRQEIFNFITWAVINQLYIISVIAVYTTVLLLWRRFRDKRVDGYMKMYSDMIVQELLNQQEEAPPPSLIEAPSRSEFFKSIALSQALQNQIRAISGRERAHLIGLYCRLNFANQDAQRTQSLFWWVRLGGTTRLSCLDLLESAPLFDRLRKDPHDLVSSTAALALSGLPHELNKYSILKELSPQAAQRSNLLLQIVSNWARIYGASFLVLNLNTETRPNIIKIIFTVLAELKTPSVGKALAEWIKNYKKNHDPHILLTVLKALLAIGDPRFVEAAIGFLNDSNPEVRAAALNLVLSLSDISALEGIYFYQQDKAFEVQRVLRRLHDKRAA